MVFTIIALVAIVITGIYVAKRTKLNSTTTVEEPTLTLHEDIVKTVQEAKNQVPVEVSTVGKKPTTTQKRAPRKPKTEQ